MFAVGGEHVDEIELAEARGIQIAALRLFVGQQKDDLLVRRGWGLGFQNRQIPDRKIANLLSGEMYVMLSRFFLSSYCFH